MPTTGPIYNLLADVYEGLLKVGLRFPKTIMLLALLAVVPGWSLGLTIPMELPSRSTLETGFMPDMDEGAFVLDYNMPVGTSLAQTDKVMRRVEDVLLKTPDISGYIRRTGAELGLLRHRALHRRHPGQPQAPGPAPADGGDLRRPPRGAQGRGPRAGDRVRAAGPGPDQRPGGRRQPDRGQGLRPRLRDAPHAGREGRQDRRGGSGRGRRQRRTSISAIPTSSSGPTASRRPGSA